MTSPDGLNVIISVAVDDQTGVLNEVPARVREMVLQTNQALAQLLAENPLLKLGEFSAAGAAELTKVETAAQELAAFMGNLARSVEELQAAAGTGLRVGISPETFNQLKTLEAELVRIAELKRLAAAPLTSVGTQQAELERIVAAVPATLPESNAQVAALRQQAAAANLLVEQAKQGKITLPSEETAALRNEANLASKEGTAQAATTQAELKAQVLAANAALQEQGLIQQALEAPTSALAQAELRLIQAQLRLNEAMAAGNVIAEVSAQRAVLSAEANYAAAQTKFEASQKQATVATGGGGGFFGGFRTGLVGGHGEDRGDFTAENIGQQIGQVAKYIYLYEAFIKVDEGIREAIKLTKEYENGLVALQVALASVGQQGAVTASQIATVGAQAGFSPGESLQAAARGIQAFRDDSSVSAAAAQRVALESVDAAQQGVVLSGQKMAESQDKIIASTRAYELGAAGQTRVLDAVTNANINFGASIKDVLDGVAQVADVGKESGFSIEQLANAIGLISSTTGLTGEQSAGDLKRILGGAGAPAFQKALTQVGVDTNQSTEQELEQLGEKYKTLTSAQQAQVVATLGGRRAAEALIPLLESVSNYQDANARSQQNGGAAAERFAKLQDTLAGILRQLGGAAKSLAVDLGQSGVGAAFGLLLEAAVPVIKALDEGVKVFDLLPSGIREATFALLEFTLAAKLLQGVELGGIGSKLLGALSFGRLGGAGVAGVAAGSEAEATLASAGAAGGVAATGGIAAFATALAPAAIALAAVGSLITVAKGVEFSHSLSKATDALNHVSDNLGTGDADALRTEASTLLAQARDLKSSSALGAGISYLTGHDPAAIQRGLVDRAGFLQSQANALDALKPQASAASLFGPNGPQSVDTLNQKIQSLTESGHTAADIVAILNTAIRQMGIQGQQAAQHIGDLTTGLQGFQGFAIRAATLAPTSITTQATRNISGRGLDPGGTFSVGLTPEKSVELQEQITTYLKTAGKDKPFATITDKDLQEIGKLYATDLDKKLGPEAQKQAIAAFIVSLRTLASTSGQRALPSSAVLDAAITQLQASQKSDLSDAQARGADSGEILRLQQRFAANLEAARQTYTKIQQPIPHSLNQEIAVADKDAFDAFATRIQQLAQIAITQAGNDKNQVARINAQTKHLLQVAQGIDPAFLPSSFRSLSEATGLTANAAVQSADADARAASAYVQARRVANQLLAEASRILEAAAAAVEASGTDPSSSLNETRYQHAARAAGALTTQAQNLVGSTVKTTPKRVNDPSYQNTIDQIGAAGAAAAASDTAAQIAAAAAAASVFPGAKLEEARVQMQIAAANLAAEKPKTVAYFTALKALHQAQYDYTQALLDAQHVSRELGIDLTDPVAVAKENLKAAQAKLAADRHAPTDKQNEDKLAVQQAQTALEAAKFQERLDAARTAHDLGQISTQKYLQILDAQRDNLLRIVKRTHQQQQELNEVNQLIQDVQKSLQTGQFNLGEIKLPTPYEVRRQVLGGSGAAVGNVQNINVNVNGGDLTAVVGVLSHFLGPAAFSNTAVSPQKI